MSIEVDSYSEDWKKNIKENAFYKRRYVKVGIVLFTVIFVAFTVMALVMGIPIPSSIAIIYVIIFFILRWFKKYIILGDTFITLCHYKKRKDCCILFKNIIEITKKKILG